MSGPAEVPPAQALAEATVDALLAGGVSDVVLAPGSRSAPMAYALLAAEQAGALALHVLVDERSAGFVALGLSSETGRPACVVVTSGSAVANLHPAMLEAAHQRVPLVAISCDRPEALVVAGASQTTEHLGLFGSGVGDGAELAPIAGGISRPRASANVSEAGEVGDAVGRLLDAARTPLPGPVHLNLAFADPLTPAAPEGFVARLRGACGASPRGLWCVSEGFVAELTTALPGFRDRRGLVLAADGADGLGPALAELTGWPLLAEPTERVWGGLAAPTALLDALGAQVECVLVAGRPTLSRQVTRLLARAGRDLDVVLVDPPGAPWLEVAGARHLDWPVAGSAASPAEPAPVAENIPPTAWRTRWEAADHEVTALLDVEVAAAIAGGELSGAVVARLVASAVLGDDGLLVAGASMAIRELDLAGVPGARVTANRGVAGIDGTVSTAIGHAFARLGAAESPAGPVRALIGDLTLQHDLGGLIRGRLEREVAAQFVVLADDGGSIFATLEHGGPEFAAAHERVFATPQRLDLAALAAAVGARYTLVTDGAALVRALGSPVVGVEIVEVQLRREGAAARRRELHERLVSAARGAAAAED